MQDSYIEMERIAKEKVKRQNQLENLDRRVHDKRQEKEHLDAIFKYQNGELVRDRKDVDDLKKNIESKMRERDLLNKDVVDQEDAAHVNNDILLTYQNEKTKLTNKITGYRAEADRLSHKMWELDQEKEKYGIEASQCNAKYYHSLE